MVGTMRKHFKVLFVGLGVSRMNLQRGLQRLEFGEGLHMAFSCQSCKGRLETRMERNMVN